MARRRKQSRTGTWRWTAAKGRKRTRKTTTAPLRRTDTVTKTVPRKGRELTAVEKRAGVDFAGLETALEAGIAKLLSGWQAVRDEQIIDLTAQIREAGGNLVAVAAVQAASKGSDVLIEQMRAVAQEGISSALAEAAAQGVTVPEPDLAALDELLANRAQAAAAVLARSLSEAAGRRAVALTSPVVAPDDVATEVRGYIETLKETWLRDQMNGLLMGSMNTGRRTVMAQATAEPRIVASAVMDSNTCAPCAEWDGHEFASLLEAERQFPFGGNSACLGGPRDRCTLVAIYDEAAPSVQ